MWQGNNIKNDEVQDEMALVDKVLKDWYFQIGLTSQKRNLRTPKLRELKKLKKVSSYSISIPLNFTFSTLLTQLFVTRLSSK